MGKIEDKVDAEVSNKAHMQMWSAAFWYEETHYLMKEGSCLQHTVPEWLAFRTQQIREEWGRDEYSQNIVPNSQKINEKLNQNEYSHVSHILCRNFLKKHHRSKVNVKL